MILYTQLFIFCFSSNSGKLAFFKLLNCYRPRPLLSWNLRPDIIALTKIVLIILNFAYIMVEHYQFVKFTALLNFE